MIFSFSTVLSRATSLRITRSLRGSSRVSVPARNLRRNLSSSRSAIRALMSPSFNSRISLLSICVRLLTSDKLGFHAELGAGKCHCLLCDLGRHALELEHHATRLHDSYPSFRRALSLTHAGFGGLLRDRLVGENSDPDFSTALDVSLKGNTSRFDLPVRNPSGLHRLQAVGAERNG